ncbi:Nucleotide-binding universal stress protein, UspA family [Jannaschia faecimaris]|uniref:Nucleotide-binding universal stress protein, UspA family n=1 Tax=Jannaschia faecimaris TaxID=1244108 RepID=A0A1H3RLV7_9RHOB|nr:universal stress protein [Jannaschia faecimaris]SDZ26656.1 Nucleotide-binding universal stress protein, UspA family [Jannaschia faecimaris]
MFKTILLAYDGSEHADHALAAAAALTKAFDSDLHIISIPEPNMPPVVLAPYGAIIDVPPSDEQVAAAGAKVTEQAREKLAAAGVTLSDSHVRRGDPVSNILQVVDATDADLIVMGRRGLGALKSLALGSVSQSVTQQVKIPCMTII